ncbi:prepilin peptidase [Aneurinibacillus tyrosinisolvens]|uniref:prepilin peptidase n=1 Tax=Aneurinibacillus tyrosinisolvens TaxID=1443435 RepID=UPI00063ED3B1|nr:A24 family peptidase [Aneurinibacillus tyrosinisolvens]
METFHLLVIIAFTLWAVITDIIKREISNRLVAIFLAYGVIYQVVEGNYVSIIVSLIVTYLISLILFRFNVFGGGDLKFFIALAVCRGLTWTFSAFYYSLIVALPLFAFYMIKTRTWSPSVPYAVAIMGGILWQNYSPLF